ncbi:MAG: hypothetical protein A3K61_01130 [Thaumarchaeota archaeon RBG_16_49_8]|nr:MAG: hypothetical protein A3K61_01130 [Thaumarchaeota archaeon RBG_16_49_8]
MIVSTLDEKRLFSKDDVTTYLNSQGYLKDREALIQILNSMIERDEFYWTLFVSDVIVEVATKSIAYVHLVSEFAKKRGSPHKNGISKTRR